MQGPRRFLQSNSWVVFSRKRSAALFYSTGFCHNSDDTSKENRIQRQPGGKFAFRLSFYTAFWQPHYVGCRSPPVLRFRSPKTTITKEKSI